MTERLYYTDAYCTRFSARVIERLAWDGRPAVVLDRTAFYPTSGGQPADRGTLGGVAVLDVVAREEDGGVVHVLEHGSPESEVEGVLDWLRRFDHMQQHTGQHILSAAFEQLLDADTVGFHLGAEASTVDIDVARMDRAAAMPVEELANRVIWEDRPVRARFVGLDELAALPLRRPPAVDGPVRIVTVADFDVNPCGGTHVVHTGEIGLIKIVGLEYRGAETRVEFLCGGRALRDYQAKNGMVHRLTALLTVGHWELDQAVERVQAEAKQLRQDLRRAGKRLLKVEANELAEIAQAGPPAVSQPYRVVSRVWERREPGEVRALAQELAQLPGVVALLGSVGERTHLCFARAEGVDLDVAALLQEACGQLGGKGGGRPHLAQGSAPPADVAQVETVLSGLVSVQQSARNEYRVP
jgi:alanyl-tRNA synthetase